MNVLRAFCALVILTLPILAHAQGTVIPPSGDTTGRTDGAAINAALSTSLSATLECNATYYTDISIQVLAGARFVGCGYNSKIEGVGTITGGIVQLSAPSVDQWATQLVGNFQIIGGTATEAVLAGGPQGSGPYVGVHMFNIWVSGGTYTNAFWFSYFFNNQADNLIAGGATTVSAACFHFDGAVNADVFNNLSATCGAPYGFYMQNDGGNGTSTGDTFNTVNAEGGCPGRGTAATCAGFYVGNQFGAITFNGLYVEAVLHPVVLGNAATGANSGGLTFNSPVLTGSSVVTNQTALFDIEDAFSVTVNAPEFNIYGLSESAPLSFSGGGCSTEPTAVAIPNPSGVIKAVTLTFQGAGCTSAPTITVGGAGSGASITAMESGGVVTKLTLAAGGSGYTLQGIVPVIYNKAVKSVTINDPYCTDYHAECWPFVVTASGASAGIEINNDALYTPAGSYIPVHMQYTGSGNQHYVQYLDSSGVTHTLSVVPQAYP